MDLHVHSAAVKHLEVVFNNLSSLNTRLDQGLATVQGEIESLAITAQAEGRLYFLKQSSEMKHQIHSVKPMLCLFLRSCFI